MHGDFQIKVIPSVGLRVFVFECTYQHSSNTLFPLTVDGVGDMKRDDNPHAEPTVTAAAWV